MEYLHSQDKDAIETDPGTISKKLIYVVYSDKRFGGRDILRLAFSKSVLLDCCFVVKLVSCYLL